MVFIQYNKGLKILNVILNESVMYTERILKFQEKM